MVKAYPKYKDSGTPWVGKVPDNWDVLPNRTLFYEIKERGHIDEQLISVTISQGIIRQTDLISNSSKKDSSNEDKSKYKLVVPGDIAYNKMRAWQGAVGVSQYRGIVSPAYIVVRPRRKLNARYFHYLLRTPAFAKEAERWSYGITSDQWSLRAEHFKMIYCPVPSTEEQKAIVEYLDAVNKIIRKYIREKQKIIKLLSEQKQAIINKAVTRGIDPNVRLKPSGVEWLGDIPEHWEVKKIKRIADFAPPKAESSFTKFSNEKVVFLPMEKVSCDGEIDCSETRPISEVWQGYTYFRKNDVIIAKITPCFENGKGACLNKLKSEFGFGTSEFIVLRAKQHEIYPEYLYKITTTQIFRLLGAESMTGAAGQQRVSSSFVKNFLVSLPPKEEQLAIKEFIDEQVSKYEGMIKKLKDSISFVQEYHSRLISDVVTGKVDVRDIKLQEVEDISESEPIEEQEILEDVEDTQEVVNADE